MTKINTELNPKMNIIEKFVFELLQNILGPSVEVQSQVDSIFGKPDYYLPKFNIAIFLDGVYWHDLRSAPMTRAGIRFMVDGELQRGNFWLTKSKENKARDRLVNKTLKESGFYVLRLKEDKINGPDPVAYVSRALSQALLKAVIKKPNPHSNSG